MTVVLVSLLAIRNQTDYPALYVSGIMAVAPPVIIAFVFQRYLIQGMLSGSTKG